jgi:molybdenum-dependent DNA-binding transcriptional regulator ModE
MKLTTKQREVLMARSIEGVCVHYRWMWLLNGEPVTRQVRALLNRGLMTSTYYSGGKGATNLTDAGRRVVAEYEGLEAAP